MKIIEILAIWFIIAVVATPFIGQWLHRRRIRNELLNLLNTSNADWAVKHRAWVARRRSGSEVKLAREALIDAAAEDQRELQREQSDFNARRLTLDEDEPFHLDEPNQPRPAA